MIGCFVTGTDTGVGKTVVTAALAMALRLRGRQVVALKPIETGWNGTASASDAERLRAIGTPALSSTEPLYRLPLPLAPLAAARAAGVVIDLDRLVAYVRRVGRDADVVLVEGVGGVLVPLARHADVRTLIRMLAFPVVVVGRTALGGVNHALLTLEALDHLPVSVRALILNTPTPETMAPDEARQIASTVELLHERSGVPILGPVHYEPMLTSSWHRAVEQIAGTSAIQDLAASVLKAGG